MTDWEVRIGCRCGRCMDERMRPEPTPPTRTVHSLHCRTRIAVLLPNYGMDCTCGVGKIEEDNS